MNNPEQYNAITEQRLADLWAAFEAALADDGARAIMLTGAGKGFCSGAQLSRLMLENPYLQKASKSLSFAPVAGRLFSRGWLRRSEQACPTFRLGRVRPSRACRSTNAHFR